MRIAQPRGKSGLNCSGDNTDIITIREKVTAFREDQQLNNAAKDSVVYKKLLAQLAPGGRLIIPDGPPGRQELTMVSRKNDRFEQVSLGAVSFVPLIPGN